MADRFIQTLRTKRYTLRRLLMVVGLLFLAIRFGVPLKDHQTHCHKSGDFIASQNLFSIGLAQTRFYEEDPDGDGIQNYARLLSELGNAGLINPYLARRWKFSYAYEMSSDGKTWTCRATPPDPPWRCPRKWPDRNCGASGGGCRYFIVCQDGVVRYSSSGSADCDSAAIE